MRGTAENLPRSVLPHQLPEGSSAAKNPPISEQNQTDYGYTDGGAEVNTNPHEPHNKPAIDWNPETSRWDRKTARVGEEIKNSLNFPRIKSFRKKSLPTIESVAEAVQAAQQAEALGLNPPTAEKITKTLEVVAEVSEVNKSVKAALARKELEEEELKWRIRTVRLIGAGKAIGAFFGAIPAGFVWALAGGLLKIASTLCREYREPISWMALGVGAGELIAAISVIYQPELVSTATSAISTASLPAVAGALIALAFYLHYRPNHPDSQPYQRVVEERRRRR